MTDQYNLVDFDEKMVLYRNQTIRLVTVIMVFALVILVLNIIVLTHHPNQLSSILSISFDSVNIILSLIEWSALYMYRQTVFKILRYMYALH
jgi:fumarate reductase subunit C